MRLAHDRFGTTYDGRPVEIYTLSNANGIEARVATYGATLVSLRVPGRSGAKEDVVLGFDTLESYLGDHPYFGSVIGRYANRIAHAAFVLDGEAYRLDANDGPHHLHGGARGFHTRLWTAQPEAMADGAALTLTYTSAHGEQGYPGNLAAEVRYAITPDDALRIDYSAATDTATVVNLTHHAYFNLAGAGTILDHVLEIAGSRYLPVNETLIPEGEPAPVRDTPFDFRTPRRVGDGLAQAHAQLARGPGYDHCWVLDTGGELEKAAARLHDPLSGRQMTIYTTQPGLQFYSGNFLDGTLAGKRGVRYPKHAGLCLETQHFPDSPNRPGFPSTVLRPGAPYRHTTIYRFGIT